MISLAVEGNSNLTAFRSLRTLRALRPLRAISRWQGMKVSSLKNRFQFNLNFIPLCIPNLSCHPLKGLLHETDFKNFDKNLQNEAYVKERGWVLNFKGARMIS